MGREFVVNSLEQMCNLMCDNYYDDRLKVNEIEPLENRKPQKTNKAKLKHSNFKDILIEKMVDKE